MRNIRKHFSKSLNIVLLIVLASKVFVFSLGFMTTYLNEGPSNPLSILMRQFCRWDGPHYIDIAKNWYVNKGEQRFFIVFFPLYPLLIRLITFDWQYVNLSALLISNLSSIIAMVYLFKLVKLDFKEDVARRSVIYLSIFPTAYFLSAIYTEGLFLVLAITCIYYARLKKWSTAGFLGMFSSLTRMTGLALLPALITEYLNQQEWKLRKINIKIFWALFPLFGFFIYLLINYQTTGNFFAFIDMQRENWHEVFDPLLGLKRAWEWTLTGNFPENITLGAAQLAFVTMGFLGFLLSLVFRLRLSHSVYAFFAWATSVSMSWWISMPRYMLVIFPIFIVLGLLGRRKIFNFVAIPVFLLLLSFFTFLFSKGAWAF
ncbi:MAG: mannosyltransferase family protein [Candidatus Bathyarchaeia archaeon]